MNNIGIYKISIDDYFYIGQSQDLKTREYNHLKMLKKGTHYNKFMQNVYNKKNKFTFNVIIPCEIEELNRWEQTLLDFNQGNKLCMNIAKDAEASARGLKFSEEHKRKIGEAQKGEKNHMYGKTGEKHHNYDHTLHTFTHEEHGEVTCTQNQLRRKYNLNSGHLAKVIKGKRKSHKGWRKKINGN